MVIISALRCPYESEYEQKTITKLDDEEKAKLDDEDKEILKKEKKQYNLTLILASVYYVILFCFQWKYQFFNEETMDYAIYAPVFACLIYIFFSYNNRKV
jgi:cell division protein FtsW (lipid II flippase)